MRSFESRYGACTSTFQGVPKSTISNCQAENEHGHDQFEVRLTKADGSKADVGVAPGGKIIQVEEKISINKVPAVVMKAFSTTYPNRHGRSGEKQTPAEGNPTYELTFATKSGSKAVTFTDSGKFVEVE